MSAGNLLSCAKVLRKVKEAEQKFEEVETGQINRCYHSEQLFSFWSLNKDFDFSEFWWWSVKSVLFLYFRCLFSSAPTERHQLRSGRWQQWVVFFFFMKSSSLEEALLSDFACICGRRQTGNAGMHLSLKTCSLPLNTKGCTHSFRHIKKENVWKDIFQRMESQITSGVCWTLQLDSAEAKKVPEMPRTAVPRMSTWGSLRPRVCFVLCG